jgi:hypothetical protein
VLLSFGLALFTPLEDGRVGGTMALRAKGRQVLTLQQPFPATEESSTPRYEGKLTHLRRRWMKLPISFTLLRSAFFATLLLE